MELEGEVNQACNRECERWIGGIGVYGYICVSCTLCMKHVFILSRVQSRVFPFSLVLIHCVHPYHSSQVIDEVQHTTCVILRTQPFYTFLCCSGESILCSNLTL